MAKIGGTAYLTQDGAQLPLGSALSFSPGRVERERKIGLSGSGGDVETPRPATLSCSLLYRGSLDLESLLESSNSTLTVELNNGCVWLLQGASITNGADIDAAAGEITLEFADDVARQITQGS